MMASPTEVAAMRQAIAASAFGLGRTSPNPPVGCVILDSAGRTAGVGYHLRKGDAHAEVNALAAAGTAARGGTAVVTLEPCNHVGRTGACRQALLDAGVARVVIAVMDPTSRGDGGAAVLRAAGVDVEVGVLEEEARLVLGPWLRALDAGRPRVVWAALDGEELPDDLLAAEVLRWSADAVLHGDGRVTEAVPGSHGLGVLRLDDLRPDAGPTDYLEAVYAAGVRGLLLSGAPGLGARLISAGRVERAVRYVSPAPPSSEGLSLALPDGFVIEDVRREGEFVRVEGRSGGG